MPLGQNSLLWSGGWRFLLYGLAILPLLALNSPYVASVQICDGQSMYPTFRSGDLILFVKKPPSELERGDVVTVELHNGEIIGKRIVGLAGDRISLHEGVVTINASPVARTCLGNDATGQVVFYEETLGNRSYQTCTVASMEAVEFYDELVVPAEHVYLLGDNRPDSEDSRYFGTVPLASITGMAYQRILNVDALLLPRNWPGLSRP